MEMGDNSRTPCYGSAKAYGVWVDGALQSAYRERSKSAFLFPFLFSV